VWEGIPLKHAPKLTREEYIPGGTTALYEAFIKAIERFSDEKKNIVLVLTDGKDNASGKGYTKAALSEKLQAYQKQPYDWSFLYLCEDPEQFEEAANMGLGGKDARSTKVDKGSLSIAACSQTTTDVLAKYMNKYI